MKANTTDSAFSGYYLILYNKAMTTAHELFTHLIHSVLFAPYIGSK